MSKFWLFAIVSITWAIVGGGRLDGDKKGKEAVFC